MLFRVKYEGTARTCDDLQYRYNNPDDGENAWPVRKARGAALNQISLKQICLDFRKH
jgi:hypothetical protein